MKKDKNPIGDHRDAVDRSMFGDMRYLTDGGCLTQIVTLIIIVGGILLLSQCSAG
ncbi:hypothetical protein [Mangrovibacillus cuniculi]|uniref:Uncharacterized protein n=1 Tax=Mangrovibacillus cuniculi TaxID=2593652 RepID=A0A7S8C8X5_9BACI|nr:hypothetical protein [Mangrovibacillus cuniculi]QPC45476.1 hypothetical protein G8O30_00900 [Mangrovibacillus cuniculi]